MRILMLEPPARDQHAGIGQRLDHRFVGVAFVALVVEYVLAGEARRLLGKASVGVNSIRNGRIDSSRRQFSRIGHPDFEVVPTVTGRSMHEAGAGIVGNMVASQKRYVELVAAG